MTRARNLANLGNKNAITADIGLFNIGIGSTQPTSYKLEVVGGNAYVGGGVTITGNLSVGGTVTYEDVTNVDAVGIVTAAKGFRATAGGIVVTAGVSTFPVVAVSAGTTTKDLKVTGVSTFVGNLNAVQGHFTDHIYIADTICHTGDTNTKIRFPAVDTVSVETGGSERARITSSGNLLVGADAVEDWDGSRDHRIQVRGSTYQTAGISILDTQNDDNPCELLLGKSRGTGNTIVGSADDVGQIRWAANDGAGFHSIAWIRGTMDGTPGSDDLPSKLTFGTSADGGTTVSERLRINSSGQVLINTTDGTGAYHLVVANPSGSDTGMSFRGGAASQQYIRFADGTSGGAENIGEIEYNHGTNSLAIDTNGTEAVRIDSSQRVMINTTTEGFASADDLTVASSGDTGITIRSGTSNQGNLYWSDGTSGAAEYQGIISYEHGDNLFRIYTLAQERLRILSNGAYQIYNSPGIGIGASTNGSTSYPSVTISGTSGGAVHFEDDGDLLADIYGSSSGLTLSTRKVTDVIKFQTNSGTVTEKAVILGTGEVGIGITNPAKTGIQNNVKVLQIDGGDGAELILGNSVSANVSDNHIGAIAFTNIDTSTGSAPHYAGIRCNCVDTSGNMNLKFYAGGGGGTGFEDDTPDVIIDELGKIGIGTADPQAILHTFHATSNTCATFQSGDSGAGINLIDDSARSSIEQNGVSLKISSDTGAEDADSDIRFQVDSSTKALINSTGTLMVGSTSCPGNKALELYQASNAALRIQNSTTGTGVSDGLLLEAGATQAILWNYENTVLLFGTDGTERMRIAGDGAWMVATTSDSPDSSTGNGMAYSSSKFRVSRSGDPCGSFNRANTTGTVVQFNYNGTQRGQVATDGTVIAYQTSSDYRLKENEVALTDGITKVKQLKPYTFNFKDSPNKIDQGFFAHEVQPVVPGAVSGTKDAVHSEDKDSDGIKAGDIDAQQMDYAKLTPLLTAALQEAIAKIETLEAKVAALESS